MKHLSQLNNKVYPYSPLYPKRLSQLLDQMNDVYNTEFMFQWHMQAILELTKLHMSHLILHRS